MNRRVRIISRNHRQLLESTHMRTKHRYGCEKVKPQATVGMHRQMINARTGILELLSREPDDICPT